MKEGRRFSIQTESREEKYQRSLGGALPRKETPRKWGPTLAQTQGGPSEAGLGAVIGRVWLPLAGPEGAARAGTGGCRSSIKFPPPVTAAEGCPPQRPSYRQAA